MKNKIVNILIALCMVLPLNTFALEKQEVVFSTLNSKGEVKESIVNNHLKYVSKDDIEDETILKNILNISGNEKFYVTDNKLVFEGKGKDITYQGTTDKELPIGVNIKYYLNGKELSKKQILNKKGKVKIVIDFKNNSYNEKYGMHTPFVVTMASIIKSDNNSNVEISNGKVVNTGTKNVIIGISIPGLYDDIKMEELKNMDAITISYDTKKYTDSDLYFVATPKVFNNADLEVFNRLDSLNSSMSLLQNGVNNLVDGANKIVDGSTLLSQKLDEATKGSKQITDGLSQINSNKSAITSMNTLVDTLYSKYQENSSLLENITNGTIQNQLETGINDATIKMTDLMEKKATYENLKALVDSNVELSEDKMMVYNQLAANILEINAGIEQYKAGIENAQKQLASLPSNAAGLIGSNQTIETILKSILKIDSMDNAKEAISSFKDNINNLASGISLLNDGSSNLTNGLVQLSDGATSLNNGTIELRDGIVKLNNDGISKLTSLTSKLDNYRDKIKSIVKMSKDYRGYSTNNAKETIFIYKVSK